MKDFTTHWNWVHECIESFGEDILATSKELELSFADTISLYRFVLELSSADCEEYYRSKNRFDNL